MAPSSERGIDSPEVAIVKGVRPPDRHFLEMLAPRLGLEIEFLDEASFSTLLDKPPEIVRVDQTDPAPGRPKHFLDIKSRDQYLTKRNFQEFRQVFRQNTSASVASRAFHYLIDIGSPNGGRDRGRYYRITKQGKLHHFPGLTVKPLTEVGIDDPELTLSGSDDVRVLSAYAIQAGSLIDTRSDIILGTYSKHAATTIFRSALVSKLIEQIQD